MNIKTLYIRPCQIFRTSVHKLKEGFPPSLNRIEFARWRWCQCVNCGYASRNNIALKDAKQVNSVRNVIGTYIRRHVVIGISWLYPGQGFFGRVDRPFIGKLTEASVFVSCEQEKHAAAEVCSIGSFPKEDTGGSAACKLICGYSAGCQNLWLGRNSFRAANSQVLNICEYKPGGIAFCSSCRYSIKNT